MDMSSKLKDIYEHSQKIIVINLKLIESTLKAYLESLEQDLVFNPVLWIWTNI